jgi:[ribosomal protein S5]-alanine N-acetyltransferase
MNLDCGKCVVRDWRRADKSVIQPLADNRRVWINLSHRFPHPYTGADADCWFDLLARQPAPTHWIIEVEGAAAGCIGIDPGEGIYAKCARFGYWLGEPYWGRGIMSAAVRATADHIFETMDLVRLEAPVFEWNPPSMRVLEKSGFVREGVMRNSVFKDGKIIDAVSYARVRRAGDAAR